MWYVAFMVHRHFYTDVDQMYECCSLCIDVFSVCVGTDDGGLQAQEQQDQRRTLPLSHLNSECVSEENILQSSASFELFYN